MTPHRKETPQTSASSALQLAFNRTSELFAVILNLILNLISILILILLLLLPLLTRPGRCVWR
jgi:hypothetical protein